MADDFDDISKDIDAAMTASEAPASIVPATDAGSPPAAALDKTVEPAAGGERARGADGKFVEKTEKTETPAVADKKPDPNALAAAAANLKNDPSVQAQAKTASAPPSNWKGNGKVEWNRLPAHIQKEIADDYTRITSTEGELGRIKAAIGNRAETLAASYGSVEQGLQNLFAISDMATKNPAGFIQWFAQQRGIDLGQYGQPQQQGQQPADAQNPLQQEVVQLRNTVQQFLQQQQQSQVSQLQAEIQTFGNDAAHPYFNDVRAEMSALMAGGRAQTLQEAYDKAVWAHPEVRQSLIAKERETATNANAQKVAQAKQAAGSLTGSPSGASVTADEPEKTLEAEIARNVARFRA